MGKMFTLAANPPSSGGNLTFLLVIVVLFGLFYFVMIRPQRNRQRRVQQMQNEVGPGSRVRTTAGMYATVTEVDGDDVLLEVAPGVNVRFMRRAIMDVVPEETEETEEAEEAEGPGTAEDAAEASPAAEAEPPVAGTAAGPVEDTVAGPVEDTAGEPAGAGKAQAGKPGAEGGSAAS